MATATTMEVSSFTMHGPVAVLTMSNPPVNGLGHALRSRILAGLDRALADHEVTALVITGGASIFSGGADVREFGTARSGMATSNPDVIRALESSGKPVVASIAGHGEMSNMPGVVPLNALGLAGGAAGVADGGPILPFARQLRS